MASGVPWLALGSAASAVGSLYLLVQLRPYLGKPGARWFVATIAVTAGWTGSYAVALAVSDPGLRLALEMVAWLGLAWIGFAFIGFALGYTGRTDVLEGWLFRSSALVPLGSSLLVLTNPLHRLVWTDFRVVESLGASAAVYTVQPLGNLTILTTLVFVSLGTLLLLDTVVSYGPLYRSEAIAVGLSPLPPGFALLVWAGGVGPAVNLTTVLFLPHIALDLYAFVRSDMFEFHPATRRAGERAAIDDIATPVAIVDVRGRVVNLNPAAEGLFGVTKRAALTEGVSDLLGGDSLDVGGEPTRLSVGTGDAVRECKVEQTALRDTAETRLGYTIVFQDVTEEIRRERRLAVLNRFLRHNVRNESVVIQARAELLTDTLDPADAEHARTIERAVDRLVESGTKARTLSEASAGRAAREETHVGDVVSAVVADLEAEYDRSVAVDVPDTLCVATQPDLFEVLVTNLVENALEHAPASPVTVAVSETATDVLLTVADEGPGVPEHELAVLERGRETDLAHGSGMGLWLVRWAVTSLEGTLDFDTSGGTTATVRLPRQRDSAAGAS